MRSRSGSSPGEGRIRPIPPQRKLGVLHQTPLSIPMASPPKGLGCCLATTRAARTSTVGDRLCWLGWTPLIAGSAAPTTPCARCRAPCSHRGPIPPLPPSANRWTPPRGVVGSLMLVTTSDVCAQRVPGTVRHGSTRRCSCRWNGRRARKRHLACIRRGGNSGRGALAPLWYAGPSASLALRRVGDAQPGLSSKPNAR